MPKATWGIQLPLPGNSALLRKVGAGTKAGREAEQGGSLEVEAESEA